MNAFSSTQLQDSNPCLVLLHGWGCASNSWEPLLPELQKIFRVIALDLPGFGKSSAIDKFSLTAVVDFIAAQLPDACVLMGWSLGGMLAVQVAARYPHKVSRVITLATNAKFVSDENYPHAMSLTTNLHFTESFARDPHATLKLFSGLIAQGDQNERALLKKTRHLISLESANDNWLQALQLLSELDNRDVFKAISQPGLHLLGEADVLVPADAATSLEHLNTTQKIKILPQAAHAVHWSQPEKVMAYIQGFFSSELIEKKRVAQSFSRAAHTYDSVASFQRCVGEELLNDLNGNDKIDTIADLGCGTGHFTRQLQEKFSRATIVNIDLAEGMLLVAREKNPGVNAWLCGDAEKLPLADASLDVIFSSLALQWCSDLPALFAELNRVLKPGGLLIFSTLGARTLHELKSAWQRVDNFVHVNHFKSCEDIKENLQKNNFSLARFEQKIHILEFEKLTDLTRGLKALGAHNINTGRATGLTGRKKITAFKVAYENLRHNNMLPATYEVLYITARKPSNN